MRKLLDRISSLLQLPQIPITYYLIGGQIIVFALTLIYPQNRDIFALRGEQILRGEWWRIASFLFQPIVTDLIFAAFTWYIFYIYGMTLEKWWGTTKYLSYLGISIIGTIFLSFLFPQTTFSNGYLYNSLFLAFAYIFPDFELRLFFVIPVKIKWLAILSWIVTGISFLLAPVPGKIQIVVSLLNFVIFFGQDIFFSTLHSNKQFMRKTQKKESIQMHTCSVCGKNNIDDPYMGIRYCRICMPERCFCEDDFEKHNHPVN